MAQAVRGRRALQQLPVAWLKMTMSPCQSTTARMALLLLPPVALLGTHEGRVMQAVVQVGAREIANVAVGPGMRVVAALQVAEAQRTGTGMGKHTGTTGSLLRQRRRKSAVNRLLQLPQLARRLPPRRWPRRGGGRTPRPLPLPAPSSRGSPSWRAD